MAELTIAQRRAALIAKRESLVTMIRNGNRTVEYDLTHVDAALQALNAEESATGGKRLIRQIYVTTVKNL